MREIDEIPGVGVHGDVCLKPALAWGRYFGRSAINRGGQLWRCPDRKLSVRC
jgi:hypothetical protein